MNNIEKFSLPQNYHGIRASQKSLLIEILSVFSSLRWAMLVQCEPSSGPLSLHETLKLSSSSSSTPSPHASSPSSQISPFLISNLVSNLAVLSSCSTVHIVGFSWALLPLSLFILHASSIIASAVRGLFCLHLVSFVDILILYARVTCRHLYLMQPLRHLIPISITKAQTSHQFHTVLSELLMFDSPWVWGDVRCSYFTTRFLI